MKSAGVVVGRVSDVRFDNESFEAAVTMLLDARYQFPRDTSAKILTSGLLGEQYIGLAAGGERVHALAWGPTDGRAIVLVHGNPTWGFLWRKVIAAMRARGESS